jgi:hypothetical protein
MCPNVPFALPFPKMRVHDTRLASRLDSGIAWLYWSSDVRLDAWRMSSFCTMISSPFARSRVASVWRKVCQATLFVDAGLKNHRLQVLAQSIRPIRGCLPLICKLANTQSSGWLYGLNAAHGLSAPIAHDALMVEAALNADLHPAPIDIRPHRPE